MIYQQGINLVKLLLLLALLAFLGGCAGTSPVAGELPESTPVTAQNNSSVAHSAAVIARNQVGVPYRYGGVDRSGFDCSGLVYYAYSNAGVTLPRTTGGLWQGLQAVPASSLRVGDILFFNIDGKVSHVGLYLGDERFVHAPSSGKTVTIADLDNAYYQKALIRGGRPDR